MENGDILGENIKRRGETFEKLMPKNGKSNKLEKYNRQE